MQSNAIKCNSHKVEVILLVLKTNCYVYNYLKQHADIICPRHDQDGIAKILKVLNWT